MNKRTTTKTAGRDQGQTTEKNYEGQFNSIDSAFDYLDGNHKPAEQAVYIDFSSNPVEMSESERKEETEQIRPFKTGTWQEVASYLQESPGNPNRAVVSEICIERFREPTAWCDQPQYGLKYI